MSTLRIPVAMSTALALLVCASSSFADDTTPPPATTPETVMAQPVQPSTTTVQQVQPMPSVTPSAQPAPVVSTTTTTAGPFYVTSEDRITERSVDRRPNRALLGTGAGIFVLSYGGSVIAGAASDREEDKRLFIPVVGPWLDLGQRDCNATPCGTSEDFAKAMIVTSGVVQGAGVLLALGGLLVPESSRVQERTRSASAEAVKPTVRVAPVSFAAGGGLGAVGRF